MSADLLLWNLLTKNAGYRRINQRFFSSDYRRLRFNERNTRGVWAMKTIDKAKTLKNEGRIGEAIDLLKEYISQNPKDGIGAYRFLSQLYLRTNEKEKAEDILSEGAKNNPENIWLKMMLADFKYFDLQQTNKAISLYKELLGQFDKPVKSTMSPYRYILKRLSNISYELDNFDDANVYFDMFIKLEPSDFYASDFTRFTKTLIKMGDLNRAKEIIALGIQTHPGELKLYNFAKGQFPKEQFEFREKKSRGKIKGVGKISIKTSLIKEGDNIYKIINEATRSVRKPGDIITISSCVVAIAEERVFTVDTIRPSKLAKLVSHFVSHKDVPFGGAAPLANPISMQIAVQEVGATRIIIGTIAGAIGKLFGKRGWFYIVAGSQSALIDDPPAAIPPYDYSVIPGPKDSFAVSNKIKELTGCEAAVIDANDLGDAWAVGYTYGVDKQKLELALSDNPAGNEDQGTPIVIVRGL